QEGSSRGYIVSQSEQARETGCALYFGGAVYPDFAALDPARYHAGLLQRAQAAGVRIVTQCAVEEIVGQGGRFRVSTNCGAVQARNVLVATNGYTGRSMPWLRRRVIPIASYLIATEEIAPALMQRAFPTRRMVTDSRKVVYYYRPSPDRQRVVFGGR